jgi:hypothetical protein
MKSFFSKILISIGLITISCVDPYDVDIKNNLHAIMVEGEITDEDRPQFVKIYSSNYNYQIVNKIPVADLKVKVVVNGMEEIKLSDDNKGTYFFPVEFKAKPEHTYQLIFEDKKGQKYQSSIEKLQASPAIDSVYDFFETDGTVAFGKPAHSNNIYIDFKDADPDPNYFQWTWRLWEKQSICLETFYYDVNCSEECYEIIYNKDLSILDDRFYNGKAVKGKLVGKIPYYQYFGALLEIKQKSLTERAYRFYRNLQNISQNTGTFADTPPQLIGGNVKNMTNDSEIISGLFTVAGVSTKKYWISRINAQINGKPIGLLGRKPYVLPNGLTAPCTPGKNKTPIMPDGWQN